MKVHLSAVCGTAMASLAGLLKARGHEVSGSDQDVYPPMSTQLEALGIALRSPYAEQNVPADADLVVIGNALSRGNPEVEVVLDRKQRYTSAPALIADEFLRGRRSLVVAGTHGKTTTSSLLAYLLERAGLDPSFLIGGVPRDFAHSFRLAGGPHFVIEGDEYDCAFFDKRPKFVHYLPDVAIVNNLEFDHADIYPDLAAVETAFFRLLQVVPRRGLLVAGIESPTLAGLLGRARSRVKTFGVGVEADWRADPLDTSPAGTRFRLSADGADAGEWLMPLPGVHNVRNALAALAAAQEAGVGLEAARAALPGFRGVRRRLELRGRQAGIAVYDDFAHHPTAVRETLRALRLLEAEALCAGGRLVAVFEPRSYTAKSSVFQEEFAQAFAEADELIVAAVHLPGKVPEGRRLSETGLARSVQALGREARFIPGVPEIVAALAAEARAGDVVAVLSNGGFGGIHQRLLDAFAARA